VRSEGTQVASELEGRWCGSFFASMCPQRAHPPEVEHLEEAVAAARNTRSNRRVLHQYENLERANYRFVEHDAAHRPEEPRITEGEDAAVRRHGPVATSVFGALDGYHRFVELLTAH
jgi:hypothetical protein